MKRGLTTANAIIIAVIVIGSIFAINLFSSLSGVEDISGDVVSTLGGFCGTKQIKTLWGATKTYTYTCPTNPPSSCEQSKCVATTPTTNTIIPPPPPLPRTISTVVEEGIPIVLDFYQFTVIEINEHYIIFERNGVQTSVQTKVPYLYLKPTDPMYDPLYTNTILNISTPLFDNNKYQVQYLFYYPTGEKARVNIRFI